MTSAVPTDSPFVRVLLTNNHCISDPTAGVTQGLRTIVEWLGAAGHDCHVLTTTRFESRVTFSIEGTEIHPPGLKEYLVVHGRARIEEGGGPELLQRLAHVYLGPDVKFPPMDEPPPGVVVHIAVDRLGGFGPWA